MNEKEFQEFIKKSHKDYFQIGAVLCPAFGNIPIHFNDHGFTHLLTKEGKPRKKPDLIRKIHLSKKAPDILRASVTFSNYTKTTRVFREGKIISVAEFWEFTKKYADSTVVVVVRKINNGLPHFFSVKDKK